MIAKIGHGVNIVGALSYNLQKVEQGNGQVLFAQKMRENTSGTFPMDSCLRSFEPYLYANRNTEKPALHISLNPDPADEVDNNRYIKMAEDYMKEMGYGEQPYIVFKHTDIERTHIHIVSTNVDRQGRKIPDTFEHRRSMQACRLLEERYGLTVPVKAKDQDTATLFKPVNHVQNDVKSQIAAVVRYLPNYYHYQSFGAYNALLSLFNITAQEVVGKMDGKPRQGIVYFALDHNGQKASNPFKASLFGKSAGQRALQLHYERSALPLKEGNAKSILKHAVEVAAHTSNGENDFRAQLVTQGINTVVRRTTEGRIYGVTFIDHASRSVWNGSQLGKNLSANAFNAWWAEGNKPEHFTAATERFLRPGGASHVKDTDTAFRTLDKTIPEVEVNAPFAALPGLLPTTQGEDYEELAFANRMKNRKNQRRKR